MKTSYDHVFITDDEDVRQWASDDTLSFYLLRYCYKSKYLRFLFDGTYTINPIWDSVLTVAEIVEQNEPLYIEDTLILNCQSIEAYSKVIPLIRGRYSRLVLHGKINWSQVTTLITADVKQVRINAEFTHEMDQTEYDYVVAYMKDFIRGRNYRFSIAYEANLPGYLEYKIREAAENGLLHAYCESKRGFHVLHWSIFALYIVNFGLFLVIPSFVHLHLKRIDSPFEEFALSMFWLGVCVSFAFVFRQSDNTTDSMNDNFVRSLKPLPFRTSRKGQVYQK